MKKKGMKRVAIAAFSLAILIAFLFPLTEIGKAAPTIPISSCQTINTPGNYQLVADLTSSSTCITITASHVDFDLNGHRITGPSGLADGPAGIQVIGVTHVDITGAGSIENFGRGIDFEGVDSSEVKRVALFGNFYGIVVSRDSITPNLNNLSEKNWFRENNASNNSQNGFLLNGASDNHFLGNGFNGNGAQGFLIVDGTGNQLKSGFALANLGSGIEAGGAGGNTITDNLADGNGIAGIVLPSGSVGNTVKGNTARNNAVVDLKDDNANCDNNVWTKNVFNTASQPCIQ